MKSLLKNASVIASVAMLAACGGPREETVHPEETGAEQVTVPATTAAPGETPVAVESPAAGETPEASATPAAGAPTVAAGSASPSPTPSATRSAAPAPVAAASPPAMFAVCGACHSTTPGDHGIGPSLAGVFGDKAGGKSGFDYSDPMKESGLAWNDANLNRFLENPREVVPGTTMAFAGVKNPAQRQAIIDYLKGL